LSQVFGAQTANIKQYQLARRSRMVEAEPR
jgi:hypothetical protein